MSGLGLEAQQTTINQFVTSREATVIASFREIASGKSHDRPELAKALRKCRSTGATLLVAKLDRLSRSVLFVTKLRESGVDFIFADMPELNTLTFTVMAGMAQHEREIISARTKAGLAEAKVRGTKLGGRDRFGDKVNTDTTAARAARTRTAARDNARFAEDIADIEEENGEPMTLKAIADALNSAGHRTPRGKEFSAATVLRIKRIAADAAA